MSSSVGTAELKSVRFARRSSRGFAFGMSKARLATLGVAFVMFAAAMATSRVFGVVTTSPVWGTALLMAYVPVHGRKIIDWLPVVLHWWWRRAIGQHRFRARPLRPRPTGTLALPGDAARLRVVIDEVTRAALVHDPHLGTLTAVLQVRHGALILVDPATQAVRADDDLEQARATGDTERAAQADAERDFLVRELARAFGLSGVARRAASASERARASVTRAIRQAMARVGKHHPELAEHLIRTIRTGTYCAYLPDPRAPAGWRL